MGNLLHCLLANWCQIVLSFKQKQLFAKDLFSSFYLYFELFILVLSFFTFSTLALAFQCFSCNLWLLII